MLTRHRDTYSNNIQCEPKVTHEGFSPLNYFTYEIPYYNQENAPPPKKEAAEANI